MSNGGISGKVYGAGAGVGLGGAIACLIMYAFRSLLDADPPPEIDQAVTTLVGAALGVWGGYLAPHSETPPAPPAGS